MRVEHLWKSFGGHEVLKDVNLEVAPGQVVVVFGRSGSGKSTLLRCINFLEEPSEGTIEVAGIRDRGRRASDTGEAGADPPGSHPHRHGVPGLQPLPAPNRAPERHRRARDRAREVCARRRGEGPRAPRDRGAPREGRPVPDPALGRTAAAHRHRPCARDEPAGDALRRADVRARPGADRRGARR